MLGDERVAGLAYYSLVGDSCVNTDLHVFARETIAAY